MRYRYSPFKMNSDDLESGLEMPVPTEPDECRWTTNSENHPQYTPQSRTLSEILTVRYAKVCREIPLALFRLEISN